jgi:SAM-dependent methyltransferase
VTSTLRDLTTEDGRKAFGEDAANYHAARPAYPDWVYEQLQARCGLGHGTRAFEIGPGTGQATARLLTLGANPLMAIEPDARLATYLQDKLAAPALTVVNETFEEAALACGSFDLGAAATSFHWLDQRTALAKVAQTLRSGGWWAMWWNVFGDPARHDAFHDATQELLSQQPCSPSQYAGMAHPFALDRDARLADLHVIDAFGDIAVEIRTWSLVLTAGQVRALYATFSQFSVLEPAERTRMLDELARIATERFGGQVERNMCTALYTARRR